MSLGGKLFIIIFVLLILSGVGVVIWMNYQFDKPLQAESEERDFVVENGDGVNIVSAKLEKEGLISDNFFFDMYIWLKRSEDKIKAGSYELSASMSPKEIVNILIGGEMAEDDRVTIPEGYNSREIAQVFGEYYASKVDSDTPEAELVIEFKNKFLEEIKDISKYKKDYPFLSNIPKGNNLEGFLFPDTYKVFANSEPEDIIRKMLDTFADKVGEDVIAEASSQELNFYEIITLASIVEKEVRSEEEMEKVAGVYFNRLDIGMKLQSDVTITYITGKKDPQPTIKDTKVESPYNTYLNEGLPPGPVGNPGLVAIKATINPASHDYFFFLTKLDTGEAIFSIDLDEHNENKQKYLN